MAKIGEYNGAPVYESFSDVEDMTKPWFVVPPESDEDQPPNDQTWEGWVDVGFTTED